MAAFATTLLEIIVIDVLEQLRLIIIFRIFLRFILHQDQTGYGFLHLARLNRNPLIRLPSISHME